MRTAQVSELKDRWDEVIEAVRNGETVEIREGETTLAEVVPTINGSDVHDLSARTTDYSGTNPDKTMLKTYLDNLVRQGKARRGIDSLPADFLTRPLPEAKRSVLEALLEDRRSD